MKEIRHKVSLFWRMKYAMRIRALYVQRKEKSMYEKLTLTSPGAPALHLDTESHMHAIDGAGKMVINPASGKPVVIALDKASWAWYAKVADFMPHKDENQMKELTALEAIHFPHEDERWRGVWVPLDYLTDEGRKKRVAKPTDGEGKDSVN